MGARRGSEAGNEGVGAGTGTRRGSEAGNKVAGAGYKVVLSG